MVRTAEEAQAAAVTLGEEAQAKEAAEIAVEAAVVTLAAEVAAALVTTVAEVQTSQAAKARAAAVEGRAPSAASETEDDELRANPLPQSEAGAAAVSAAELEAGAAAASAAELEAGAAAVSAAELEAGAAAASAAAAEQEARAQWIAYHLSVSELEEARELGWTGDEASAAAEVAAAARVVAAAAAAAAATMPAASAVGAEEDEDEEDGEEDEVDEEEAIARLLAPSALARANTIAGHVEGAYGRAITMTGRPPSAEPPMAGSPDRAQWIAYHLSVGELAEARELGWVDDEAAAQAAWGEAAEAAEAAAAAAHHRQSAVGWLATWGEATAARLDRKMAAEGEALGEAAEPGLVDAAVGWMANLFSPRAAVGVAMTEEEEEEAARRRAATVVQAVARGRVARHSRDFGISGARPAELEVGTSSTRDRNLEELRGSGSPYIQRICSRSGSPYDSPDMQRDMQRSAGSPVQAHLDRVAQEVSRSPAPGESTEAMVRRFSPVGLPVLHAPPSPPALVAGYVAPAVARRELHFEADVASSVSQAVMLQAWGRVLLAKVRVRTAKRDYRQQALAEHVRAKSAARIQIAYRSPDRPPRAASAPPSSSPLSSQQRRAAARRRSEGTPLPLLPSPATDARRAALLYSASPGRSPGWSPTARPTGPPSLPKPSPQRAQTLKRLMAQARLGRSLIGLTHSPVARRTTCASSRLVSPLAPLAVTPTSHPTSPSHFTFLAAAATQLTSGLSFRL